MNLLANPLADAQKVWNNVKGAKEPRAAIGRADKENEATVFSFITPSIIGESPAAARYPVLYRVPS